MWAYIMRSLAVVPFVAFVFVSALCRLVAGW